MKIVFGYEGYKGKQKEIIESAILGSLYTLPSLIVTEHHIKASMYLSLLRQAWARSVARQVYIMLF